MIHNSRIYLDYSASTPIALEVKAAMEPYLTEYFGNPSSIHFWGQKAQAALDLSRETIAKELNADFNEVIFTASATEANNLVVKGIVAGNKGIGKPRIIVSAIEHESVLEPAKQLEKEGVEVIYLPVSKDGFVNPEDLKNALNESTILVSIIYASNEIGAIQPIREIAKIVNGSRYKIHDTRYPILHTDAVQAFQFLKLDLQELGVDALTISSHKIYGPKGAAALVIKRDYQEALLPIVTGGGQEYGLRSGTENVPVIVGFAKAVELVSKNRQKEAKRIEELRNYFWQKLKIAKPELELNGSFINRLPNNLNVYFPDQESEDLLIKLDQARIAVSAGSACSARAILPSHVIAALGLGEKRARQSLRFTLGQLTTREEIDIALARIINLV